MFRKIADRFREFMIGRNGQDSLGIAMFAVGFVCLILSMIFGRFVWSSLFNLLSWLMLLLCIFRMCSKNIAKRSAENRAFLNFCRPLTDRNHRYFRCPGCRQVVRVPRGRGKINITCPKCANKFIKKT